VSVYVFEHICVCVCLCSCGFGFMCYPADLLVSDFVGLPHAAIETECENAIRNRSLPPGRPVLRPVRGRFVFSHTIHVARAVWQVLLDLYSSSICVFVCVSCNAKVLFWGPWVVASGGPMWASGSTAFTPQNISPVGLT
jgi:hypothetical protein